MSKTLDIRELLRIAVIDERSGQGLYRELAVRAEDRRLKRRFARLEAQEHEHERRFQQMLDGLPGPVETGAKPDAYVDYLETLIAEGRARGPESGQAAARKAETDLQALDLAMRFERDQLLLLADIGTALGIRDRELINAVVEEERAHLVDLAAAKRELQDG